MVSVNVNIHPDDFGPEKVGLVCGHEGQRDLEKIDAFVLV